MKINEYIKKANLKEIQALIAWATVMGKLNVVKAAVAEIEFREQMVNFWVPMAEYYDGVSFDTLYKWALDAEILSVQLFLGSLEE